MYYQLWELTSGNLVDEFDAEEEALATVRAYLAPGGEPFVGELSLSCERDDGELVWKLEGQELARRAGRLSPERA